MPPEMILDPTAIDTERVLFDKEAIRRVNLQRFEMEQLDAVVWMDTDRHILAGYKDVRDDEFWVRGHIPGYPLLPGVLMCEAAAQLSGFYVCHNRVMGKEGDFMGFGGMENVRFRAPVQPGQRLLLIGKCTKIHRLRMTFNVQGFVGPVMVFQADIQGVIMDQGK